MRHFANVWLWECAAEGRQCTAAASGLKSIRPSDWAGRTAAAARLALWQQLCGHADQVQHSEVPSYSDCAKGWQRAAAASRLQSIRPSDWAGRTAAAARLTFRHQLCGHADQVRHFARPTGCETMLQMSGSAQLQYAGSRVAPILPAGQVQRHCSPSACSSAAAQTR